MPMPHRLHVRQTFSKESFISGLKRFSYSLALALLLCISCYYFDNGVNFPIGQQMEFLGFYEEVFGGNEEMADDYLFINTCYNKSVIEYEIKGIPKGENEFYKGTIDITDRSFLNSLLFRLNEFDNYKYICLDIRFEDGFMTDVDSILFSQIGSMRDIVIPAHADASLSDSTLAHKTAYSDALALMSSLGFTFYRFIQDGGESIPLRIYREQTGNNIKKRFGAYFDGRRPCLNNLFLRIPSDYSQETSYQNGQELHYYDGPVVINDPSLEQLVAGKMVFIGDFTEDLSSTYRGNQPNPYLIYLATESLFNHKHLVSWRLFFTLLCIYTIMFFFALSGLLQKLGAHVKSRYLILRIIVSALLIIVSLFGYNLLLYLVQGIIIHSFGIILPIFLQTLVLSAVGTAAGLHSSSK